MPDLFDAMQEFIDRGIERAAVGRKAESWHDSEYCDARRREAGARARVSEALREFIRRECHQQGKDA